MSSSIIQPRKNKKLTDKNYAMWKSIQNMILVINNLHFALMNEYPPFHARNAYQNFRDSYNRWTKVNDKVHIYLLSNMSNILSKKHEIMSLHVRSWNPLKKCLRDKKKERQTLPIPRGFRRIHPLKPRLHLYPLGLRKFENGGKGKRLAATAKGKGKDKVAEKEKYFLYNVNKHRKRNYPKHVVEKKNEKEGKYDLFVLETCLVEND